MNIVFYYFELNLQTNYIHDEFGDNPEIRPLLYADHTPYFLSTKLKKIKSKYDILGLVEQGKERPIDWRYTDVSLNNEICMFPHTIFANEMIIPNAVFTKKNSLFTPLADSLVNYMKDKPKNLKTIDGEKFYQMRGSNNNYDASRSIGGIYLGCEWLLSLFKGEYYDENNNPKEDCTLYGIIEKIWNTINKTCGD